MIGLRIKFILKLVLIRLKFLVWFFFDDIFVMKVDVVDMVVLVIFDRVCVRKRMMMF